MLAELIPALAVELQDLRGLTLRQPWNWAILHAGKPVENRPMRAPRMLAGKWFALHAGAVYDERVYVVQEVSLGFVPGPPPHSHRGRKQHRWEAREKRVEGRPELWWSCRNCPLERHWERGPLGGAVVVFRADGVELARGPLTSTAVPSCPPAPKGGA